MVKFQIHSYNTFGYIELLFSDGRTESDAYESTVQYAQVGSNILHLQYRATVRLFFEGQPPIAKKYGFIIFPLISFS